MIIVGFFGSIFYYIAIISFFILATPFAFTTWLVTLPFDRYRKVSHWFNCFVGHAIIGFNPFWSVKVHNREKIDPKETYVLAPNHQSLVDIPVLAHLFPMNFKYVSKKELTYVPLLGWIMAFANYVLLSRKDPKSQVKMMKKCEHYLKNEFSIGIFPEGTRSKNGELGRFKDGASLLAKITEKKVLPICMAGNSKAMPNKGFIWTKRVTFNMYILDPIDPKDFKKTKEVSVAIRDAIQEQLNKL